MANTNIIKTKLIRGEYWDIVEVQGVEGVNYTIINTKQKEQDKSGTTEPVSIRTFKSADEAVAFMDEIIDFGDIVEIELNDGQKLEGTFVRCAGVECGFDYNGQMICIENGFGIVGKIKDKDDTDADWTIKPEQCKNIKKLKSK